jgi:hypothetical protein
MSATIHYLRPFAREPLDEPEATPQHAAEPHPEAQAATPEDGHQAGAPEPKRKPRRAMPCGRNSPFKKRMDGSVVSRQEPKPR